MIAFDRGDDLGQCERRGEFETACAIGLQPVERRSADERNERLTPGRADTEDLRRERIEVRRCRKPDQRPCIRFEVHHAVDVDVVWAPLFAFRIAIELQHEVRQSA